MSAYDPKRTFYEVRGLRGDELNQGGGYANGIGCLCCCCGDSIGWLFSLESRRPNLARSHEYPSTITKFHAYSTSSLRRTGTLLPCGIYQAVRSAALLVRAVRGALLSVGLSQVVSQNCRKSERPPQLARGCRIVKLVLHLGT